MGWPVSVAILIVLIYSTVIDIKYREIPIELYLCCLLPTAVLAQIWGFGPPLLEAIISAVVWGLVYFVLALFFGGGGGDIVMAAILSLWLGKHMALVVGVATVLLSVVIFIQKRRNRSGSIPSAPFFLAGYIIDRLLFIFA